MAYTEEQIAHFAESADMWLHRQDDLVTALFVREFRSPKTSEFVKHGLGRRLSTLKHTLQRTFNVLPPDEENPTNDALLDATSYLQTFVINVFGAIDNLARIWVMEANITQPNGRNLRPMQIGLTPDHAVVRASFSESFQEFIGSTDEWFGYLEDYRHALAHRIPLYIPPRQLDNAASAEFRRLEDEIAHSLGNPERYFTLRSEQRRLGVFNPLMMHSYEEQAHPVFLHPQMICDFATVVEIGEKMLNELNGLPAIPI